MFSLSVRGVSFERARSRSVRFYCNGVDSTVTLHQECGPRTSAQNPNAEKPVDGARPCSSSTQADGFPAQSLACFLRGSCWKRGQKSLAGRGRMPGFWGEAAWLCALLFLSSTSSLRGIRDRPPPLRLFGLRHCTHSGSCSDSDVLPK